MDSTGQGRLVGQSGRRPQAWCGRSRYGRRLPPSLERRNRRGLVGQACGGCGDRGDAHDAADDLRGSGPDRPGRQRERNLRLGRGLPAERRLTDLALQDCARGERSELFELVQPASDSLGRRLSLDSVFSRRSERRALRCGYQSRPGPVCPSAARQQPLHQFPGRTGCSYRRTPLAQAVCTQRFSRLGLHPSQPVVSISQWNPRESSDGGYRQGRTLAHPGLGLPRDPP